MEHNAEKEKKKVRIWTKRGYCYAGRIISEDEGFFHIHDEKTDSELLISKTWVSTVEILEGGVILESP